MPPDVSLLTTNQVKLCLKSDYIEIEGFCKGDELAKYLDEVRDLSNHWRDR